MTTNSKKMISIVLVLALCLSLAACGSKVKLTTTDVETALADRPGTLDIETSGDNVKSFTYTADNINAEGLIDREYSLEAIALLSSGNTSQITPNQLYVCNAFLDLMCIDGLFRDNEDEFNTLEYIEKLLDVICDGKTLEYDGWSISTDVNQNSESIKISVVQK